MNFSFFPVSIFLTMLVLSCTVSTTNLEEVSTTEELYLGDSTRIPGIKKLVSEIYGNSDSLIFDLTNEQLREIRTFGTSLRGHFANNSINRIIATSTTANGQLSTEWYFINNQVIYVYETFEYFNEIAKPYQWTNFKGLKGWESRYYITDNQIVCQRHIGLTRQMIAESKNRIIKEGMTALNHLIK